MSAKATATKVQVTEITVGQTIHGNLVMGTHEVARIEIATTDGLRNKSSEYQIFNAEGEMVFIGRINSKVRLAG